MNQYEPHPWTVHQDDDDFAHYIVVTEFEAVADIYQCGRAQERAHLISAAYEGYALADIIRDFSKFDEETWRLNRGKIIALALEYLAKAEGK